MKDGSLLVSDDWNGAVYRITYGKQKVAGEVSRFDTMIVIAERSAEAIHASTAVQSVTLRDVAQDALRVWPGNDEK